MRKVKKTCLLALFLWLIVSISMAAEPKKRIGILTFSDQLRYLEAKRGFVDILKKAGIDRMQTEFYIGNAEANKAVATELVTKFGTAQLDLIFTVGTHATLAIMQEIKDIPVVFAQVYDPVDAGIARDWISSGNNSTGVSTKVPMSKLLESLKEFTPVKNLAVLYTPGEKNSESQLRDLQKVQADYGIKAIPVPLNKPQEIQQLLPIVLLKTDALYITGSNLVNSQMAAIVEMAIEAKIPTISHLEDLVEKGVLLGVGPNSYLIGRLAGEKAVKVLQGTNPSSIPIETLKHFDVIINLKTAKAGGFQIPPDFMKTVSKIID
jgi:putative tryptophan/tyrosine transport system substrate-binding protein